MTGQVSPLRPIIDGIILAGGQSKRLQGEDKAELVHGGARLLEHAIAALAVARQVVIVGPYRNQVDVGGACWTREEPPGGGPVAGIAAGVTTLDAQAAQPAEWIAVLACDMPGVGYGFPTLVAAIRAEGAMWIGDGVVASDAGRRQHLLAIYRASALRGALAELATVRDVSVRRLIADLELSEVPVLTGSGRDIDTWADARHFGIEGKAP